MTRDTEKNRGVMGMHAKKDITVCHSDGVRPEILSGRVGERLCVGEGKPAFSVKESSEHQRNNR